MDWLPIKRRKNIAGKCSSDDKCKRLGGGDDDKIGVATRETLALSDS